MAEHRTTRLGLRYGDWNDPRPDVQISYDWQLLDAQAALGSLAVVVAEYPSATPRVVVRGGLYVNAAGAPVATADSAPVGVTVGTTYLYLNAAGAVIAGAGWPAPGAGKFAPLAIVTSDGATITSIVDCRRPLILVGS